MIRSMIICCALFTATMSAPAMAHVGHATHTHAGDFIWLIVPLAIAGVACLIVLRRRKAAARS